MENSFWDRGICWERQQLFLGVPEIIQDGVNGFIVDNINEMAKAVRKTEIISSEKCRESVEKRFSVERMVDEYENLFKKIASK